MRIRTSAWTSFVGLLGAAAIAAGAAGCAQPETRALGPTSFASPTVDFGIIVSDIDRAGNFYKNTLGLTELPGFDVPAGMAGDSGLAAYKPFHVRVYVAENKPGATQVKLMQFTDTLAKQPDNAFIHSTFGIRYLTFHVTDIAACVERARKAGYPTIAKGPVPLPAGFPKGIYLAVLRDPDGNMIELVVPKPEEAKKAK